MHERTEQEIVRRADRCLGLAVRKGQAKGKIAKSGDIGGTPAKGFRGGKPGGRRGDHLDRALDFFSDKGERHNSYVMPDGVTDDQLELDFENGDLTRAELECFA